MFDYYLQAFRQFADFRGRTRRREYWHFTLINMAILISLFLVFLFSFNGDGTVSYISLVMMVVFSIVLFIPSLAISVRRLHDSGKSGWFFLLNFIPTIGALIHLIFMCLDSEYGENKWGPNPKGFGNENELEELGME